MSLIRDLLREYLLHGGPRLGQRLAHEYTLCRELGCRRNVLREALSLLAAYGLVHRERGRGTHVLTTSPAIRIDQGLDLMAALRAEADQPAAGTPARGTPTTARRVSRGSGSAGAAGQPRMLTAFTRTGRMVTLTRDWPGRSCSRRSALYFAPTWSAKE